MKSIKASGLDVALRHALDAGTPVLGICLGLQISLDHSEEGDTPTLGLIEGRVVRFRLDDPALKIPHMGWNEVTRREAASAAAQRVAGRRVLLRALLLPGSEAERGGLRRPPTTSAPLLRVRARKLFATQFHPEKSGRVGLELLARFAAWDGRPC